MNEKRQIKYDEMTKDVTTTITGNDGYEWFVVNPRDYNNLAVKYHAQQEEIARLRGALETRTIERNRLGLRLKGLSVR